MALLHSAHGCRLHPHQLQSIDNNTLNYSTTTLLLQLLLL